MKNLMLILVVCLGLFSCQKEIIKPNEQVTEQVSDSVVFEEQVITDTLVENEFVTISFNDIFESGLDSVYIFKNDIFVETVAVGCGNVFFAELNEKYSFKKKHKDSLVNLYGFSYNPPTYLTFLTTSTNPVYCSDYLQEGLYIATVVNNEDDKCENVHYTFNAWF
jgi:hypothetical protein